MRTLWATTAGKIRSYPVLEKTISVDVGVIGGGYTGCSTALHSSQLGLTVAVLEAKKLGHGCSGRNSGNLNPGLWISQREVIASLGEDCGLALNKMLLGGPNYVKELVKQHKIECELTTSGTLHCAATNAGMRELRQRLAELTAQGQNAVLLDAAAVERRTGSKAYLGAIANQDAAWIQPFAYLHGIASAAANSGAEFYENSTVVRVLRQEGIWLLETASGSVRCKKLLIATGAYHADLAFGGSSDYAPVSYFNFSTPPLVGSKYNHIVPDKEGCWDTSKIMVSFTRDNGGRFIIGSVGSLNGLGQKFHHRWARRKMVSLFPALAGVDFEHSWHGIIDMTSEHMPRVIDHGENAIGIFGYSGRGIAPGTMFGRAAARYFADNDPGHFAVPITKPKTSILNQPRGVYANVGSLIFHVFDERMLGRLVFQVLDGRTP